MVRSPLGSDIARDAEPLVGLADDAAIGIALRDLERAVSRASLTTMTS